MKSNTFVSMTMQLLPSSQTILQNSAFIGLLFTAWVTTYARSRSHDCNYDINLVILDYEKTFIFHASIKSIDKEESQLQLKLG